MMTKVAKLNKILNIKPIKIKELYMKLVNKKNLESKCLIYNNNMPTINVILFLTCLILYLIITTVTTLLFCFL